MVYKNRDDLCFFPYYYVNIVDVSAIRLIFGDQCIYLILSQREESEGTKKGKVSNLRAV